jgi:hypothetical protein
MAPASAQNRGSAAVEPGAPTSQLGAFGNRKQTCVSNFLERADVSPPRGMVPMETLCFDRHDVRPAHSPSSVKRGFYYTSPTHPAKSTPLNDKF